MLPLRVSRPWARFAVWGEFAVALVAAALGVAWLCHPEAGLAIATVGLGGIVLGWVIGCRLMFLAVDPLAAIIEAAAEDSDSQRRLDNS